MTSFRFVSKFRFSSHLEAHMLNNGQLTVDREGNNVLRTLTVAAVV